MRPPSPAPPPRSPRHPHRGKHLPSGIDIWRPLDMLLAASNESKHEEERRSNTRTKHDSSHELLWMKIKITHRQNGLSVGSHETDEPEWIRQLQQNATNVSSSAASAKLQASLLFNRSLHRKWLPVPPALYLTPSFFLSPHKQTDRPQLRALLGRWRRRHALRQRGLRGLLELTTHQQPAAAKQRAEQIKLQA